MFHPKWRSVRLVVEQLNKLIVSSLSRIILLFLIAFVSVIFGWQLEKAIAQNKDNNYQIGRELYLENCASCHIPIPAEVLPTETWQQILENPQQHYGESLPRMIGLNIRLIWNYLRTFSRPLLPEEPKPEYVTNSRYFKALHPQVDLPQPVTHQSCILCHPGAQQLDYRTLSPEWEGSQ
ncbi:cytochrome C [Pleurocapsales cyanobacterium LEGE 06147]|nr:cytochrome C [Pleurocapsales cyanobacterium LEGE 06147]